MGLLYKASDFVVCRAGATTIAELCVFGMPSILIPYQKAGSHQLPNAEFLQEKGASLIIEENDLSPNTLKDALVSLALDPEKLKIMGEAARSLYKIDAAKKLADVVLGKKS